MEAFLEEVELRNAAGVMVAIRLKRKKRYVLDLRNTKVEVLKKNRKPAPGKLSDFDDLPWHKTTTMLRIITSFCLLAMNFHLMAQSCYDIALTEGKKYYNQGKYAKAIEIWQNGKKCAQTEVKILAQWIWRAKDTDGDGVVNGKDKCPSDYAKTSNGCPPPAPDQDGDGVADESDECPTRPGPSRNQGCPESDQDNDGIPDVDDNCPSVPGIASNKGCPKILEPEMVYVEGGTFQMGSNDGDDDEKPIHAVKIKDFYIGKYEVTQAEWATVMGDNPSNFKGCDQCPVEQVSWDDAQAYIKKLNEKTGKKYRLPTEAEWEFAARGGNKSKSFKYAGSNNLDEVAWNFENSEDKTHPVGTKKANELGLCDMSGNVLEWCSDYYGENYYEQFVQKQADNHVGPVTGNSRVMRGGSWHPEAGGCRSSDREWRYTQKRFIHDGLRLAEDY